ncbi:MAG TPA: tetratricopeptide repeat protein [Methanotrichaceae archaeon]|nr:tetratricopeptide repeat protein [Methanotrichaceae archaeon]
MDPLLLILIGFVLISAIAFAAVRKFVIANSDFWMSMGLILADRGRYERAARCCEKAVKIYPFYVHAWNNRGLALCQLGRYEEALECLEEALTLNPDLGEAWQNKGLVLEKLERQKEAEEAFQRAKALGIGL